MTYLGAVWPLFIEIDRGDIFATSPDLEHRVRINFRALELILAASCEGGVDISSGRNYDNLLRAGLVKPIKDVRESLPQPWNDWGALAWTFHEWTRGVHFVERGSEEMDRLFEKLANKKTPPLTKIQKLKQSGHIVLLPRVFRDMNVSFKSVLETRRTHRIFEPLPIRLDDLSTLLHYTFSPIRFADAREFGTVELRASVSAGARHETTACVAIFNVEGLNPGLYVYDQIRHGLIPLNESGEREYFESVTANQGFNDNSAATVITVADSSSMSWKYNDARSYRLMMMNVGSLAQTFSMVSTALGYGAAITGALDEKSLEKKLGLEVPREIPTFSLTIGIPSRRPDGLPNDYIAAQTTYLPHSFDGSGC